MWVDNFQLAFTHISHHTIISHEGNGVIRPDEQILSGENAAGTGEAAYCGGCKWRIERTGKDKKAEGHP